MYKLTQRQDTLLLILITELLYMHDYPQNDVFTDKKIQLITANKFRKIDQYMFGRH